MLFCLILLSSVLSAAVVQDSANEDPLGELVGRSINSVSLENDLTLGLATYHTQKRLGSSGQAINVWLDTGSYAMLVNPKRFNFNISKSETAINTTDHFKTRFGFDSSTCVQGSQFIDNLVTDSGLSASSIRFSLEEGYGPYNLAGLPPTLIEGSVINSFHHNKQIESRSFSLWLAGGTQYGGKIIYGGVDRSKYTGNLGLVPMRVDMNGNPSGSSCVRKLYAYNQCGDKAVTYEGVISLGFDSGNPIGSIPTVSSDALKFAFNASLASGHPAALQAGFKPTDQVVQYLGGGGYIFDLHGVELKVDLAWFLRDAKNKFVESLEVGQFYSLGYIKSGTTFELGPPTFFLRVSIMLPTGIASSLHLHKRQARIVPSHRAILSPLEALVSPALLRPPITVMPSLLLHLLPTAPICLGHRAPLVPRVYRVTLLKECSALRAEAQ